MPTHSAMLIDVVDEKNRVVGQTERGVLLEGHFNFRTVHILLFDDSRRILLQRLSARHVRSAGLLGSSSAGYLKAHESYLEAAQRKLQEELALTPRIRRVGVFDMPDLGARKFVAIYTGTIRVEPTILDSNVAAIEYWKIPDLESQMKREPAAFTPTFQAVYDHFRHWRARRAR